MKSNAHAWILSGLVVYKLHLLKLNCKKECLHLTVLWLSDGYEISKRKFQFIHYMFDLHSYLWTIQSIDWLSPWVLIIYNARTAAISISTVDWTLLWNDGMWRRRIIDAMTLAILALCWFDGSIEDVAEVKGREGRENTFNSMFFFRLLNPTDFECDGMHSAH